MKLLSTDDAAFATGVDPATIRQWHKRGKLTRYGTAKRALWSMTELVAAMTPKARARRDGVAFDVGLTKCHAIPRTTGSAFPSRSSSNA